jgi:hypothetical protein
MALLDLKTPSSICAVVRSVPQDARLDALRGANPALFRELEHVSAKPRRSRELTADTVAELISWLTDPAVIADIVAGDPREAVSQAAAAQLRHLDAPPPPTANSKNRILRTQRALAKPDVVTALQDLGKDIADWKTVEEWFVNLPERPRSSVSIELYRHALHDNAQPEARDFAALIVLRSFDLLDDMLPQYLLNGLGTRATQVGYLALSKVTGPFTERMAEYFIAGNFNASAVEPMEISPGAIALLREAHRHDLIVRCEALEPEVIATEIGDVSYRDIAEMVFCARSARYVDALAPKLTGFDSNTESAAKALAISGISKAARSMLLRCAPAMTVAETFAGRVGDTPEHDEQVAFAKMSSKDRRASVKDVVAKLTMVTGEPEEPLLSFALALWEHSDEMLNTVLTMSWRHSWVTEACMQVTAEAFENIPNAWGTFFTVAKSNAAASGSDVIRAVLAVGGAEL